SNGSEAAVVSTTSTPSGPSRRRARSALGGQPSLTAMRAGNVGGLSDHLATAGADVQRRADARQPPGQQAGIAPRWALLAGPAVEPFETPPANVGSCSLVHQFLERSHTSTVVTVACLHGPHPRHRHVRRRQDHAAGGTGAKG